MVIYDQGRPMLASNAGQIARFTEILEWGNRLAETSHGLDPKDKSKNPRGLWDARGWKEFVEHIAPERRPYVAIALENCRARFGALDEVTRTSSLGTFDKWIFPVIANMAENDVIDQLVSLQPMAGPVSQVVYMDIVTGKRKGAVPAGTPFWRALQGAVDRYNDSDELVENEPIGTTSGGALTTTGLDYTPVRPGTLKITIGAETLTDNSNGVIAGTVAGTGTIVYATGVIVLASVPTTTDAFATYVYNSEGNLNNMDYELKLASSPVTAKVRKLKAVWSEEADQNLQAMYNIKAESTVLNALTNALQYQKHREVVFDLRARADAGLVQWDATPPTNVSYQTHKLSMVDAFEVASQFIYISTNMVRGNWVLAGAQTVAVVTTLPQFVSKYNKTTMQGVTYIGDLSDKRIFADPHYPVNEWLMGFKGGDFMTTGYVLAEYQKLYTTPDIMLPDFLHQRGFATSYAKKLINAKMFARGTVANSPVSFGPVIG